jgi:glycosyltransferase involved in cell wall biosynthesis
LRIAILWTKLSGYLNACLKELASREQVELLVLHQAPGDDAPFEDAQFGWVTERYSWRTSQDLEKLEDRVLAFAPELLLFSGWHVPVYRRVAKGLAGKCWRVMGMDNCWHSTLKQRGATWIASQFVLPLADAVWLPGERQALFARKLGFSQNVILRGLYSCDQPSIETVHLERLKEQRVVPKSFVFVGRFVPQKCVDHLADAYEIYRREEADPWPLICCGAGPLESLLKSRTGVTVEGFVQPHLMPRLLSRAGCLILPSRFEPWAVVVHEATSAGLLVLASEEVGAAPHLVQPGYNGFVFSKGDVVGLASLMSRISAMNDGCLDEMSRASFLLSRQYSPKRWADTLLSSFAATRTRRQSDVAYRAALMQ